MNGFRLCLSSSDVQIDRVILEESTARLNRRQFLNQEGMQQVRSRNCVESPIPLVKGIEV